MQEDQLEFSLSKQTLAYCDVLSLSGELDMLSVPELSAAIETLDTSTRPVIVDLSELSFLDSHGIHTLMKAKADGRSLILVCPDGHITRLLEIVQAKRQFPIYNHLDDVLAEIAQEQR